MTTREDSAAGGSIRRRITIDVDDAMQWDELNNKRIRELYGNAQDFYLAALWKARYPEIQFKTRAHTDLVHLPAFLEGAREVVMLGINLHSLLDEKIGRFLTGCIDAKVPLTFMLMAPDIKEKNPALHSVLEERFPGTLETRERVQGKIQELYERAKAKGCKFTAHGLYSIPFCGAAIKDPFHPTNCALIITPYVHRRNLDMNPFFEIYNRGDEGKAACNVFLMHYMMLLEFSTKLLFTEARDN